MCQNSNYKEIAKNGPSERGCVKLFFVVSTGLYLHFVYKMVVFTTAATSLTINNEALLI